MIEQDIEAIPAVNIGMAFLLILLAGRNLKPL